MLQHEIFSKGEPMDFDAIAARLASVPRYAGDPVPDGAGVATPGLPDREPEPVADDATPATPAPLPNHDAPPVHTAVSALEQQPPIVITEAGQLDAVLLVLCEAPLIGVDTETTGLDPLTDR